jgi:hypothetical protein
MGSRVDIAGGVVLGCALLLTGCGQTPAQTVPHDHASKAGGPSTAAGQAVCHEPGARDLRAAAPLAADVNVSAVVRCTGSLEEVPSEGEWSFILRKKATGAQVDALVKALRLTSEPPTNGACPAILRGPVTVDLETADGPLTVTAPTDPCGLTRNEVSDAYQALHWVVVSRTRGQQERPEAAVAAGCDESKDMLALIAGNARAGGPDTVLPEVPGDADLRVCLYRSVYPPGWTPSGNFVADGEPVGGGKLVAADVERLTELLSSAAPARACTSRHTQFAVVTAVSEQSFEPLYVELDGCLRVVALDGTPRQGGPELAAMLTAVSNASP